MSTQGILIRDERTADHAAISAVTIAAFATQEISNHTEQFVIEALRTAQALSISLVAEINERIVGHIAFSPVTMSDGSTGWYGLGPVSIHPDFQHKGIGKTLIREGLSRLMNTGAKGCCLVGHPEYYRQFGFENAAALTLEGVPPEVFFVLSFNGQIPQGTVTFSDAFKTRGPVES